MNLESSDLQAISPLPVTAPAAGGHARRARRLARPSEGVVGEHRGKLGGWLGFPGLMLIPALAMIGIFMVYPAILAFRVAGQSWTGFSPVAQNVGWGNFRQLFAIHHFFDKLKSLDIPSLFADPIFYSSLKNSIVWMIVGGAGHFLFAIIFAAGLQDPKLRAKKFFQTLIIFPMFISAIGIAMLWCQLYNPRQGMINMLLSIFHLADPTQGTPAWLDPSHGIYPLLLASIWGGVGGQVILILAGLRQIPETLYEAARMDGATEWQCFWRISLPLTRGILKIAVVLWIIESLQVFGLVQGLLGPDIEPKLHVISTYMFQMAFNNRSNIYMMGQATAMAVVLVILTLLIVLIILGVYRLIFGKDEVEF